jgi:hypothetical protein
MTGWMSVSRIKPIIEQIRSKFFGVLARFPVNSLIKGKEVPCQTVDQNSPHEAFLDQESVVVERRKEQTQPGGCTGLSGNAIQLTFQHLIGDGNTPKTVQCRRLLEVILNTVLQHGVDNHLFELVSRTDLVGVVEPLNRLLDLYTLLEAQATSPYSHRHTQNGNEQAKASDASPSIHNRKPVNV